MFTGHKSVVRTWVLVFLTLALSKAGSAQLVLYDNFKSNRIDPSKWVGTSGDPDQLDVVRQVAGEEEDRRLRLSQTAYSATNDDVGSSGNIFGLEFPLPSAITEVSFSVNVKNAVAVGCTSNPQLTLTGPEFRGRFFNTENSPTSQLGDVEVGIGPGRASTDTGPSMLAVFHYERCADDFCGTRTTLGFGVLGVVQPGTTNVFHIKWDKPNHRFIFQLNNQPLVFSPYSVSDSASPNGAFKAIDVARVVPHCTATPRPVASVDAFFDDVDVNP